MTIEDNKTNVKPPNLNTGTLKSPSKEKTPTEQFSIDNENKGKFKDKCVEDPSAIYSEYSDKIISYMIYPDSNFLTFWNISLIAITCYYVIFGLNFKSTNYIEVF